MDDKNTNKCISTNNINKLFNDFINKNTESDVKDKATTKQKNYINILKNTCIRNTNNLMEILLEKEDLTKQEAIMLIKMLKRYQKLNLKQRIQLLNFDIKNINKILKLDENNKSIKEINYSQYKKIINILDYNISNNTVYTNIMQIKNYPILTTTEFEYGYQLSDKCINNKLYYIVFFNLLMIDIDDNNLDFNVLTVKLNKLKLTGRIYKTYNGYHIFITSHKIYYNTSESKYILDYFGSDIYYNIYSSVYGFRIRLNKKIRNNNIEPFVSKYIKTIGNTPELPILVNYINLTEFYIMHHNLNNK